VGIRAQADVELTWLRQPAAELFRIFGDGGSPAAGIDYDEADRLNALAIPAWPDGEERGGLGFGPLGQTPLGYGASGPGLGRGPLGYGPLGIGAGTITHRLEGLPDAKHTLAAVGYDPAGNRQTPATTTVGVVVAGEPAPPKTLRASTLAAGRLTLTFTRSTDDEDA